MNRKLWLIAAVPGVLVFLTSFMHAQDAKTDDVEQGRESLARTKRTMRKIDSNGNGSFEKNENAAAWRRLKNLDTNRDGVITVDELGKRRLAYLETGGKRKLDIVYKQISGRSLHLDLYYPTTKKTTTKKTTGKNPTTKNDDENSLAPVVVYTHGGGWAAGSKHGITNGSFKIVFQKLIERGFAVASINYRLCRPDRKVAMRDCVIDCKDAVRYLAQKSSSLKLDPNRFFVMGDSAGGQIAQMLLLTSPKSLPGDKDLASTTFKMVAGISWYGPCDFEKTELFNHDNRADFRDRFGPRILGTNSDPSVKQKLYREMSPVNYLNKNSPPLLMIQGDKDTTIPVKHACHMKNKADSVGAPVEILIVRNAGHNWRKVEADIDPSRQTIINRTVRFFVDRLQE